MSKTISHNARLLELGVGRTIDIRNNILDIFSAQTFDDFIDGSNWYENAHNLALDIANAKRVSPVNGAAVISHLSPRTTWDRNVDGAMWVGGITDKRPPGLMSRNVENAFKALDASEPWSTFSPTARKTIAFARNILDMNYENGLEPITLDAWALRIAGVPETYIGRKGVYDAIEHCYRLAAKQVGIKGSDIQAITWVTVRRNKSLLNR